jgi:hypothetical protein
MGEITGRKNPFKPAKNLDQGKSKVNCIVASDEFVFGFRNKTTIALPLKVALTSAEKLRFERF